MTNRLAIIGGGAAGFFCAVNAARLNPGMQVLLLEKSGKLLSKVKISGGGRCNVTHACYDIVEMAKRYPRGSNFVKKAFHRFFTSDTIEWFRERGVQLKTEPDGRMFPVTDSSDTIIQCLLQEAARYQVEVRLHAEIVSLQKTNGLFVLQTAKGERIEADQVVVACGGYPKAAMFDWIQQTGHTIEPPAPSLFTFNLPGESLCQLMGISVSHVKISIPGTKFTEEGPLLITHWGISGPAVLKLSAKAARWLAEHNYNCAIQVNWLPAFHEQSLQHSLQQWRTDAAGNKMEARSVFGLPQRLWLYFLEQAGVKPGIRWADLPAKELNKLARLLCNQTFVMKGKTTFKEEFVTAGGISTAEVDPQTMMSRKVAGLYFAGEVLDVDGVTGGFNFQHAWTSGWVAAGAIAARE